MNPPLAFLNMGPSELLIIGIIALLVFGSRLPEVGRSLGRGLMEFKKGLSGIKDELDDVQSEADRRVEAELEQRRESELLEDLQREPSQDEEPAPGQEELPEPQTEVDGPVSSHPSADA